MTHQHAAFEISDETDNFVESSHMPNASNKQKVHNLFYILSDVFAGIQDTISWHRNTRFSD